MLIAPFVEGAASRGHAPGVIQPTSGDILCQPVSAHQLLPRPAYRLRAVRVEQLVGMFQGCSSLSARSRTKCVPQFGHWVSTRLAALSFTRAYRSCRYTKSVA